MRRGSVVVMYLLIALASEAKSRGARHETRSLRIQLRLTQALQGSLASAVVLRWSDGAILAAQGDDRPATPGSTLKPLALAWAVRHDVIGVDATVFCQRSLRVGTQALPCTHPPDVKIFTAQSALAESCNTYFAALGARMRGPDFEAALRSTKLPHPDATHDTTEQRELTILGLRGVSATPLQLARAYRDMLQKEAPDSPILRGLADSVQFGMADPAHVDGVKLLGKTGTASGTGETWTHGWFAGAVLGQMIVVIYLPRGDGGDAALLAGKFVRAALVERK